MPAVTLARGDCGIMATGDLVCSVGHKVAPRDGPCDGIHAGWRWTGSDLVLDCDRYGFFPLFTARTESRCIIATDLATVLEATGDAILDYDALSVFLRIGFFLGGDTPFAAVRVVPPGARLTWAAAGPSLTSAFPIPPPQRMCRDVAMDVFLAHFDMAIAARVPDGPYLLPLSGGRDSRHILLALIAAGHPPDACVTVEHYPPRGNEDASVARTVCERLGLRHVVVQQRPDRYRVEREKNRRTHFCTDEHAQFIALADYLRDTTSVTYDGVAGDVLSQNTYLNPDVHERFARADERAAAEYILEGYGNGVSEEALARVVSPELLREVPRERAMARLVREIRRHLGAPNPVSSFFFWNRTRRTIALSPFGVMREVVVHAPFLDTAVFDLLASLPAEVQMDCRFHTEAIARAYPHVADVPYETTTERTVRPAWQRRLARDVIRVARAPSLRPRTLLPRLGATLLDGRGDRLWFAPLAIYLAQLDEAASRVR